VKLHKTRKHLWGIVYGVVLAAYVVFTLLDAFVIPKNVVSIENNITQDLTDNTEDTTVSHEPVVTDTSYVSDDVSINITTVRRFDTNIYIADVVISSYAYLSAGLAQGSFGRNITDTTSNIAAECNAILAINGDYYGFRDTGAVIRNGYLYRTGARSSDSESLAIYTNGEMKILNEADVDAGSLLEQGVFQLFSFGPGLVNNGKISVTSGQEVEQSMRSNPRTAIGMISPLHYLFVVSDGRTSASTGLSLSQLAEVMLDAGCSVAYNLDGGGSSTMWFMGNVINQPTTNGKTISERRVSDIVYIR
jgi:exopolysaccharide biosynthesis protein